MKKYDIIKLKMGMKTIMDKKQTMAYIKNLTGEDTEIVMECLLADKNDFFKDD